MPGEGTTRGRGAGRGRGRAARGSARTAAGSSGTGSTSGSAAPAREAANTSTSSAISPASRTSNHPQPAESATSAAARGSSVSRFRPKNIRRDVASRDKLARQELDKDNAKAKEEARQQARSRGRVKRGRGDLMGRGGSNRITTASGPFSQFCAEASGRSGGFQSFGFGGGSGGGSGFSGREGASFKSKEEASFGSATWSKFGEPRINADRFAGVPPDHEMDADDEATAALINAEPDVHWPMGILRVDRKEEKKALATTAELEAEEQAQTEESLWVDGQGWTSNKTPPEQDDAVWHAAPEGLAGIKTEADSEGYMDIDPVDFNAHSRQAQQTIVIDSKPPTPPTDHEGQKKMAPPLDPEEALEAEQRRIMLEELGPGPDGLLSRNKDGRLYLFQFPPILPPLKPVETPAAAAPNIKAEPTDTVTLDQPHATSTVDLTNLPDEKPNIAELDKETKQSKRETPQLPKKGGHIGKLLVRRSGKVELDWGGMMMEVRPGIERNFLTTAVIVEDDGREKPNAEGYHGNAYGMGRIMGRFVVAPIWGDEEPWVVDPADLVPDEESKDGA